MKKNGYKIIITSPHYQNCTIGNLSIENKTALFFGTEMKGATPAAALHADGFVKMPMNSFIKSLNISVAAAITFYSLVNRLKNGKTFWQLTG